MLIRDGMHQIAFFNVLTDLAVGPLRDWTKYRHDTNGQRGAYPNVHRIRANFFA